MQHLDDGMINELLDGEIASSELAPIAQHLAGCSECSARLEQARKMIAAADSLVLRLDEEVAVAPPAMPALVKRVAIWPRNLAWAASLIVAVGVGYISGYSPKPDAARTAAIVTTESTPVASTPTVANESIQPVVVAEQRATQPIVAGSTASVDRQREPETDRQQSDRAQEQATTSDAAKPAAKALVTAPAEAVPATAPTVNQSALGATSRREIAADAQGLAARGKASVDSVGTPAGTLFRIEGLTLLRSDVLPDQVRLIYSHPYGEVTLVQRRIGSQMAWHLEVPVGFPTDTLNELLGRVR